MRNIITFPRISSFVLGLGFTALIAPACDPATSDRSLSEEDAEHEDCGCKPGDQLDQPGDKPGKPGDKPGKPGDKPGKPGDKPGDEPGDGKCGPDGPKPECHDAFHLCIEDGGSKF